MYRSRLIKEDRREMEAIIDEVLSWDWDKYYRASGGPPALEDEPYRGPPPLEIEPDAVAIPEQ
jgi:hypothetical protein